LSPNNKKHPCIYDNHQLASKLFSKKKSHKFSFHFIEDDQAANMPILVTSTPRLEEQMQELQRKLAQKEMEIANFTTYLENRKREKANQVHSSENSYYSVRYQGVHCLGD